VSYQTAFAAAGAVFILFIIQEKFLSVKFFGKECGEKEKI